MRRQTTEHPFGRTKARMGAAHIRMTTKPRIGAEMALDVLGFIFTCVMNFVGQADRGAHAGIAAGFASPF